MTTALAKATEHFRNKLNGTMQVVEVPEWDNLKIYYKDTNTLKEQAKLIELAQQNKVVEALVETLIVKARNEDGTKMFSALDKNTFLNEVDPNVVIRVVGEINEVTAAPGIGDAEKN
jgi:hypothetical protein